MSFLVSVWFAWEVLTVVETVNDWDVVRPLVTVETHDNMCPVHL